MYCGGLEASWKAVGTTTSPTGTYYAAYQAAITALIREGFSNATWGHDEVQALFSGQLVRRRKLYPSGLVGVLNKLSEMRIRADYGRAMVSRPDAQSMLRDALEFLTLVLGAGNA
jgi:HEPN domain